MARVSSLVRLLCVGALAFSLSGCGGGGGGGGQSQSNNAFRVTLQTTSISFNYRQGEQQLAKPIHATWSGTPPATVYVRAVVEGNAIDPLIPVTIEGNGATALVQPAASLAVGSHAGQIRFLVCSDAACNQPIGGSPLTIPYSIEVRQPIFTAPALVSFEYMYGTTPSGSAVVGIAANAGAWTATTNASWLILSKTNGTGADTVTITFDPRATPNGMDGTFESSITFESSDSKRIVPAKLVVTRPRLTASIPSLSFVAVNGAPIPGQVVTISLSNEASLPLTLSSSQPWLKYSASGSTPQLVTVNIDPTAGPLPSGAYSGTLNVEAGNGTNNLMLDLPVNLTLTPPQLTASPSSIVLGGPLGRSFDDVSLSLTLDTGENAHGWTMSAPPEWGIPNQTSGTTNAAGQTVTFTPIRAQSSPGIATTTLTFTAQVNGDTVVREVPVTFNLDTHRLIASENGIALVTTDDPNWRRLEHTIRVRSNFDFPVEWEALASDQWLSVTSSGRAGDDIVITANPSGLNAGLHEATITISSLDSSITSPETVRVGLWVGGALSERYSIWDGFPNGTTDVMVADPIRPYAYIRTGTGIIVRNLYNEDLVTTIDLPPTFDRTITVSSDGSRLYTYANETVLSFELPSFQPLSSFPARNTNSSNPLDYIKFVRLDGVGLIMGRTEQVYVADTGEAFDGNIIGLVGAPADGHHLFLHNMRFDVDFTSAGGFVRSYEPEYVQVGELDVGNNGQTATNANGSRVYLGQRSLRRYDGQAMTALSSISETDVSFVDVAVGSNGLVAASTYMMPDGSEDVFVYSPDGDQVLKFRAVPWSSTDGPAFRSLIFSGDGFLVAVGTRSNTLEVVPARSGP